MKYRWTIFWTKVHDILFPKCHPRHIGEMNSLLNDFENTEVLYAHLKEQLNVNEVFKDKTIKVFEVIFAGSGETLVIGKNKTGWKESYFKNWIQQNIYLAESMKEDPKITPETLKEIEKIIAEMEEIISQLSG